MARGTPDEEVYQPRVSAEDLPRKIIPRANADTFGAGIAQEVGSIGSFITQKYQADSSTWAGDQLTKARLASAQALDDAQRNAPEGDQTGFTQKYLTNFDKSTATLIQSAKDNPFASRMLTHGIQELRGTLEANSMQWEAEQNVKYDRTSVLNNAKSQLALAEAHPEMGVQIGASITDQINNMRVNGPEDRQALKDAIYPQIALAEANGLTRQDPRGALQSLNDPEKAPAQFKSILNGLNDAQREAVRSKANEHLGDGVYDAMAGGRFRDAQRALLRNADVMDSKTFDRLQGAINSAQEHQMVMQDKAQHDMSDSLLKNAIKMSMDGQLTSQWIEKNHNVWTPSAYEYANKLLTGADVKTDTSTYLDLLKRKVAGEDVTNEAMGAASRKLLDKTDAARLMEGAGENVPPLFKRGHDYIQQAGQVSQLEPDPAKAQTLANMQNDWNDIYQQNKAEYDKEPARGEKAFRDLVSRYQLVPAERNLLGLPVPRYFQGTRIAPDIEATKKLTIKAFKDQTIGKEEFDRQAFLLQQWQQAAEIAAQRKAKAAADAAKANQ